MIGASFSIEFSTVEGVVSEEFGSTIAEKIVSAIDFIYRSKYEAALDILCNFPTSENSRFKELVMLMVELFIYNHTFNINKLADVENRFEQFLSRQEIEKKNEMIIIGICQIILADFHEKINFDKAVVSIKRARDWIEKVNTANSEMYEDFVIAKLADYIQDYCTSIPAFNKCLIETSKEVYIDQIVIRLELVRTQFKNSQYEQGLANLEMIDQTNLKQYPLLFGLYNLRYGNGLHYTNHGSKAHHFFQNAISAFQTIDNKYLLAQTYQCVGMNDLDLLYMDKAIISFKKAAAMYQVIGMDDKSLESTIMIFHTYTYMGNISEIYNYYPLVTGDLQHLENIYQAHAYMSIATLLAIEENFNDSKTFILKSVNSLKSIEKVKGAIISSYLISLCVHYFNHQFSNDILIKISDLYDNHDNIVIQSVQKFNKALVFKLLPGKRETTIHLLEQVINECEIQPVIVPSLTDLIESYVRYMYENDEERYIDEVLVHIQRLENLAVKSGSVFIQILSKGMWYKFLLIQLKIEEAIQVLLDTIQSSKVANAPAIGEFFSREYESLLKFKNDWINLQDKDVSVAKRIEMSKIFSFMLRKGGSSSSSPEF